MVGAKDVGFVGPGQMMSIRAVLVVFELAIMTQIQDPKVAVDAAVSCVSHTKRQAGIVWEAMHEDRVSPPRPPTPIRGSFGFGRFQKRLVYLVGLPKPKIRTGSD
jgi:hypothetical protein